MMKTITGGPFQVMQAVGSGTSLAPSTTPVFARHWMTKDWMLMLHGDLKAGFNHQGGPRGIGKAESQNWMMVMAERPVGPGRLMLRGMFSAEPLTAPHGGFPELFQTGETYRSVPIIDSQHPHDLFMELAATYTASLSDRISIHFYGGPVGEPALGPVAFMHRASAAENPSAPLGHHMQDSTHISHGVVTAGATLWRFRIESSLFHGKEPDENRADTELGKIDSWSARAWFTPAPDWTLQFSRGHLINPEALNLGNVSRTTASISHNRAWTDGNWASTLIWGRDDTKGHGISNSYLAESTVNFKDKNYLYARLELVDKSLLFLPNIFGRPGRFSVLQPVLRTGGKDFNPRYHFLPALGAGRMGAYTFGGVRDVLAGPTLRLGLGADLTFYNVPRVAQPGYGSNPTSFHLFVRIRPGRLL
ncbi:MAG TPA: hypothetical protein VGL91_14065 [Acidobacteriota bacterium]